jgi:hypothetical protein
MVQRRKLHQESFFGTEMDGCPAPLCLDGPFSNTMCLDKVFGGRPGESLDKMAITFPLRFINPTTKAKKQLKNFNRASNGGHLTLEDSYRRPPKVSPSTFDKWEYDDNSDDELMILSREPVSDVAPDPRVFKIKPRVWTDEFPTATATKNAIPQADDRVVTFEGHLEELNTLMMDESNASWEMDADVSSESCLTPIIPNLHLVCPIESDPIFDQSLYPDDEYIYIDEDLDIDNMPIVPQQNKAFPTPVPDTPTAGGHGDMTVLIGCGGSEGSEQRLEPHINPKNVIFTSTRIVLARLRTSLLF